MEKIFKVKARKEDMATIEDLLRHMEYLGHVGASRNLLVRVDGDGDGRISVLDENDQKLNNKEYNIEQNLGQGALVAIYDIG